MTTVGIKVDQGAQRNASGITMQRCRTITVNVQLRSGSLQEVNGGMVLETSRQMLSTPGETSEADQAALLNGKCWKRPLSEPDPSSFRPLASDALLKVTSEFD